MPSGNIPSKTVLYFHGIKFNPATKLKWLKELAEKIDA